MLFTALCIVLAICLLFQQTRLETWKGRAKEAIRLLNGWKETYSRFSGFKCKECHGQFLLERKRLGDVHISGLHCPYCNHHYRSYDNAFQAVKEANRIVENYEKGESI